MRFSTGSCCRGPRGRADGLLPPVRENYRTERREVCCCGRGVPVRVQVRAGGDGWARTKERAWNDKSLLEHLRASWADAQNSALQAAGCVDRVDHRSLADQREAALNAGDLVAAEALDRPPEPRLGVAASAIEDRARREADRFGEEYQPVTPRGRALQEARTLRSVLLSAVETVRATALRVLDLFQAVSAPVEDPFSAPPQEPPEEAYDGLPGFG